MYKKKSPRIGWVVRNGIIESIACLWTIQSSKVFDLYNMQIDDMGASNDYIGFLLGVTYGELQRVQVLQHSNGIQRIMSYPTIK